MWQNKYFKQTPLQAKLTACLFFSNYCFEVLFPAVFFTTLPKYLKKVEGSILNIPKTTNIPTMTDQSDLNIV